MLQIQSKPVVTGRYYSVYEYHLYSEYRLYWRNNFLIISSSNLYVKINNYL
jgi:hypothetical protein